MIDRGVGAPDFDEQHYNKFVSYGQSKTANVLFALYLRNKLAKDGIQAIAVHPGTIGTGLVRYYSDSAITNTIARYVLWFNAIWGIGGYKTIDQGAATTVVAALDPQLGTLKDTEGLYLSDCQPGQAEPHATDWESAEKLWTLSEELVQEKFPL